MTPITALDSPGVLLQNLQIKELLSTNDKAAAFGLHLTYSDAIELIESRSLTLRNCGRIELDIGTMKKLIDAFSDSPYIDQQEYVLTLSGLQELFYLAKNASNDSISDDALILIMKELYNKDCFGSLELLQDLVSHYLESVVRQKNGEYINLLSANTRQNQA